MLHPLSTLPIILVSLIHLPQGSNSHTPSNASQDPIPASTRAHWMRATLSVLSSLSSPCQFAPFTSVIVNHSDTSSGPEGKLICIGINQIQQKGNPTLHGEIATINNCSEIFARSGMSPDEVARQWEELSIYTNGEPCPMCASAIRWAGFKECVYGTSIKTASARGWSQISISSEEIFEESKGLKSSTRLVKDVLADETDPYFSWQFDESYPCPEGCVRADNGGNCVEMERIRHDDL